MNKICGTPNGIIKSSKLSFLGAGNLPETIIKALIQKLNFNAENIAVYDKNKVQYERYNSFDILKADTLREALNYGKIIFLAVKPQNFSELLAWIKELDINLTGKIFVSLAASVTIEYICGQLEQNIAVIRTMANTPVMMGEGMTAMCRNERTTENDFAEVRNIFDSVGKTLILPEEKMNKIISVNGSSPAYVYLLADAMIKGAEAQGFDRDEIYEAVIQSMYGAVTMLKESGKTPDELIKLVASSGGTTESALNSLNSDNFYDVIKKAMGRCTDRADELTNYCCQLKDFQGVALKPIQETF